MTDSRQEISLVQHLDCLARNRWIGHRGGAPDPTGHSRPRPLPASPVITVFRTNGCFAGGGTGYQPVTFYSEGSVGGLAARCNLGATSSCSSPCCRRGPIHCAGQQDAAFGVSVCSVWGQGNPDGRVTSVEEADAWIGRIGLDRAGRRIGRITRVWIDDYSGLPTWATLVSGRLDRREGIAPLSEVAATGGRPQFACTKAEVMSAPRVEDDGHLALDDEWRLINHYKVAGTPDPTRQSPACELPGSMSRMTTSTPTRLGSRPPGPGSATSGSAAEGQDQRADQGGPSGRLFLPGMRRRLGLG